jgi:hypothetical protein
VTGRPGENPRNAIRGSTLERTMKFMELADEDMDERVRDVFLLLGSALPSGSERDVRGASFKQLRYICVLAGLTDDASLGDFTRAINEAGGLDSLQAHTMIDKLLEQKVERNSPNPS